MTSELLLATWQTFYMVLISSLFATILGLPVGIILQITKADGIMQHVLFNRILSALVNALRSIPFIILLIAIIPFTRLIVGTSIGTTAAIVPLTIGAAPFIARIVENALLEVGSNLIETGIAMGASTWQIIIKILLPEAAAGIIHGITVVVITLVGYSAMAGTVGGGGLGDLAIQYGYERFQVNVMLATIVILIIMVQLIQMTGDWLSRQFSHKGE